MPFVGAEDSTPTDDYYRPTTDFCYVPIMKKCRTAVVGCGALANGAHLPTIHESDHLLLQALCDIDEPAAKSSCEKWGALRYETDWHKITDADDIDLIVLCTHTNLRGEILCEAMRKGIPVYTEKPLADSLEEMEEVRAVHRETGVPICVGHNRRSSPSMLEFRRLVMKAREEGADRVAIIDRSEEKTASIQEEDQMQMLIRVNDDHRTWKGWIYDDEAGIILAEMVHFIDIGLWFNPSPPVEVFAMGSNRGNFTEIIRFEDGSMLTLQHTMVGNFDFPKELFEVTVKNVTLSLNHHLTIEQRGMNSEPFRTSFDLKDGGEFSEETGIEAFHVAVDSLQEKAEAGEHTDMHFASPNKGHADQLHRFAAHIQGNGGNPCPLDGAILVTQVALSLLESVRSGLPVKLK